MSDELSPAPVAASSPRAPRLPRITDEQIEACRTADGLVRALAVLGLVNDEGVVCPQCGKASDLKKFSIKPDGGYKHFGADGCWGGAGSAITLLREAPLNLTFPDAVRAVLGQPTTVDVPEPSSMPSFTVRSFKAVHDLEVYAGVLAYGRRAFDGAGVQAALDFYGQWHIHPDVVAESGAVYITNPDHFAEKIVERFGLERLLACGLFVISSKDTPVCLVNRKWPVVEPARWSDGTVHNLQFRASNEQYARYLRHKAKELPYEGNQKFVQLKGNPPTATGFDVINRLPDDSQVTVVEGFKDRLAAATMGSYAVGFPGTGYRPAAREIEALQRHRVVLCFDGDEAGQKAVNGTVRVEEDGSTTQVSTGLSGHLLDSGVANLAYHPLAGGMDVTDTLVARYAAAGCGCTACQAMRPRLTA